MIKSVVDQFPGNQEVTMSSTNLIIFPGSTSEKQDPNSLASQGEKIDTSNAVTVPLRILADMLDRENSERTRKMIRESLCNYDFSTSLEYSSTTTSALFTHMTALRLSFISAQPINQPLADDYIGNIEHLIEAARIATLIARLEKSRPRDVYPVNFGDSTRRALHNLVNFYRLAFFHTVINRFGREVKQGNIINVRELVSLVYDHTTRDWQEDIVTVTKPDMIKAMNRLKLVADIR